MEARSSDGGKYSKYKDGDKHSSLKNAEIKYPKVYEAWVFWLSTEIMNSTLAVMINDLSMMFFKCKAGFTVNFTIKKEL